MLDVSLSLSLLFPSLFVFCFSLMGCFFVLAFRQGTHGIQMTSIKKRRSPDDELLYLPVSSLYLCFYAMFSILLSALRQVNCSLRCHRELRSVARIGMWNTFPRDVSILNACSKQNL